MNQVMRNKIRHLLVSMTLPRLDAEKSSTRKTAKKTKIDTVILKYQSRNLHGVNLLKLLTSENVTSSRWSFDPNITGDNKKTPTIGKAHLTLFCLGRVLSGMKLYYML